jgi:hypothetical protein
MSTQIQVKNPKTMAFILMLGAFAGLFGETALYPIAVLLYLHCKYISIAVKVEDIFEKLLYKEAVGLNQAYRRCLSSLKTFLEPRYHLPFFKGSYRRCERPKGKIKRLLLCGVPFFISSNYPVVKHFSIWVDSDYHL